MPGAEDGGSSLHCNDPADNWAFRMIHLLKGKKGGAEGGPVSPSVTSRDVLQIR